MTQHAPWHDVDWDSLSHFNTATPEFIIQAFDTIYDENSTPIQITVVLIELLSTNDEITGRAVETTPHIVGLLLPIIARDNFSSLFGVVDWLYQTLHHFQALRQSHPLPMQYSIVISDTHKQVQKNMHHIIAALDASSQQVREPVIELCVACYDSLPQLAPAMMARYDREPVVRLRSLLLEGLCRMSNRYLQSWQGLTSITAQSFPEVRSVAESLVWFATRVLDNESDNNLRDHAANLAIVVSDRPVNHIVFAQLQDYVTHRFEAYTHFLTDNPVALSNQQFIDLLQNPSLPLDHVFSVLVRLLEKMGLMEFGVTRESDLLYMYSYRNYAIPDQFDRMQKGYPPAMFRVMRIIADLDRFWEHESNFLEIYLTCRHDRLLVIDYLAKLESGN